MQGQEGEKTEGGLEMGALSLQMSGTEQCVGESPAESKECGEGAASTSGTHRAAGTTQGAGDGMSAAQAQAAVPKATGKPEMALLFSHSKIALLI